MAATKEYSVQEKLLSLAKLQMVDSKLDEIKVLKGELPIEVSDLEDELAGLKTRQVKIEEEINGMSDFIAAKKVAIKEGEEQLKKYDKQTNEVKNSREFEAINKEVEMQQLEIKLYEKNIRDANDDLAEKVKILDAAKKQYSLKEGVFNQKKTELQKIIQETVKEEYHFLELSEEARKQIEERLLYSYDRIRKSYRNGLAVVPVRRDACGGCFNAVPPQRQSEIRQHKKLIVCENCGRILIDEELHAGLEVK
jgi:predicted  nucleic acid-binding Zn-ribbon protein